MLSPLRNGSHPAVPGNLPDHSSQTTPVTLHPGLSRIRHYLTLQARSSDLPFVTTYLALRAPASPPTMALEYQVASCLRSSLQSPPAMAQQTPHQYDCALERGF